MILNLLIDLMILEFAQYYDESHLRDDRTKFDQNFFFFLAKLVFLKLNR
jgi:hypothetical protein